MTTVSPEGLGAALDKIFKDNANITLAQSNRALRATVVQNWGDIIKSTPVKDGGAKGGWQLTIGSPATTQGEKSKTKGPSYVLANTKKEMFGAKWFLTNNLPYILKLEFGGYGTLNPIDVTTNGFSKQAPAGMVRINTVRFTTQLARAFKATV